MKFILIASLFVAQAALAVTSKHHAPKAELHVSVCESRMQDVFRKLGLDLFEPEQREVTYADTEDRRYLPQGLTVRTRDTKTTVKIKVGSLDAIDPRFFEDDDFKCEQDRSGETLSLNCSLDSKSGLTRKQTRLAKIAVPDFDEDALSDYGPAEDSVWKDYETEIGTLDFERYRYPNGDEVLEVSTRVDAGDVSKAYKDLQSFLATHAVRVCPDQTSKTKSFFAHF